MSARAQLMRPGASVILPAVPCAINTAKPDLQPGDFVADWNREKIDWGTACWQFESSLVVEWAIEEEADLLNSKRHLKAKELATSQAELLGSCVS